MVGDALGQADQERLAQIRAAEATVAAAEDSLLDARRRLNRLRGFMPVPAMDDVELTDREAALEAKLGGLGPADVPGQGEAD